MGMKNIPGGHNLFISDNEVNKKIENVYSKFKHMLLKRDDTSKNAMTAILTKVNDMLAEKGSRFLTGETLCCFDCELMPKLQHVRVSGQRSVRSWSRRRTPPPSHHRWPPKEQTKLCK